MTSKQLAADIRRTAKKLRRETKKYSPKGTEIITINWGLPYIGIDLYNGQESKEYFFQGEHASELLEEAVEAGNKHSVSVENVLLWQSTNWG